MLILRVAVGLVLLLICVGGVFWYGVYLFGPSQPHRRDVQNTTDDQRRS